MSGADDYEHALGGLRGHIVYGEQTAGDTPVAWVQVKVALPYLRDAERALVAERTRADAAEEALTRLRSKHAAVYRQATHDRELRVAAEEALTTAREERDAARAEAAGLRAAHDEKADTCERLYADYCDALSERDAAQREIARMRSAVEGRISPPSAAEMREHMESGGAWLVTEPAVRGLRPTSVTHYVERYARATVLWWTEGALWVAVRDGRPCPSPVLP